MTGARFGPYRLEALLGRGGMGEVHRALDTRKDRMIALKRLPAELAVDENYRSRFLYEAQVAARLNEPHVIPIHDYGEISGQLYLDMRLVDGVDLATVLRSGALPPDRAVAIVGQVASALDAAHRGELVHRDVKPSNILVTGRPGDEFVYLIDFGIARTVSGERTATTTGGAVGTLAYMAPERFAQERGTDHRIDVYSLGCVLYELLTGFRPFDGMTEAQLVHAHLHLPPPRPSERHPGLPAGVDDVVATAMAKDPERRYRSTGELAADARSSLLGMPRPPVPGPGPVSGRAEPVVPGRPAPFGDPPRRVGRRPVLLGLVGGAAVLTAGTTAAVLATRNGAPPPARRAPGVVGRIPVASLGEGIAMAPEGDRLYVGARGAVTVYDIASRRPLASVPVAAGGGDMAVSGDGTRLFQSSQQAQQVTVVDVTRSVVDAGRASVVATIPVGSGAYGLTLSLDGRRGFVTNSQRNLVTVLDTNQNSVARTIPLNGASTDAAVTQDGSTVYVANSRSNVVSVLDASTGNVQKLIPGVYGPFGISLSPNGESAYVSSIGTGSLSVIDTRTSLVVTTIPGIVAAPGNEAGRIEVSPDGRRLYSVGDRTGTVTIVDLEAKAVVAAVATGSEAYGVAISPDGRFAFVPSFSGKFVAVIDTAVD